MNIYIYSDESGVFDKKHNNIFVFGGVIMLGTESKDEWSRKYSTAEKTLREIKNVGKDYELKATQVQVLPPFSLKPPRLTSRLYLLWLYYLM